jgi:hypothetical protein
LPLDEGSGLVAYDKSGYENDGSLLPVVDGPSWVDGKHGKALSFDGNDDHVNLGDDASLDIEQESFSLVAWVKPATLIETYKYFVARGGNHTGLYRSTSQLVFMMWKASGGSIGVGTGINSIAIDQWYHVVGTYEKCTSEMKIYLNGDLKDSDILPDPLDLTSNWYVGGIISNPTYAFQGIVDEVRIYNRALTETEIKRLYNGIRPTFAWFKGEPPKSRWPGFPWGWVEWSGGVMEAPVGSKAMIRDSFYIVVVDKHIEADKAEDSVMDFAESVEAALDDSPTIGGLVAASYVVNREKQKVFLGDYSMVALRITLATRRRE